MDHHKIQLSRCELMSTVTIGLSTIDKLTQTGHKQELAQMGLAFHPSTLKKIEL
jgi:hypothetical protein